MTAPTEIPEVEGCPGCDGEGVVSLELGRHDDVCPDFRTEIDDSGPVECVRCLSCRVALPPCPACEDYSPGRKRPESAPTDTKAPESLADESAAIAMSGPPVHPVEQAIEAVRRHRAELDAMAGDYYCAFPPTAEERDELIEVFAKTLREATFLETADGPGEAADSNATPRTFVIYDSRAISDSAIAMSSPETFTVVYDEDADVHRWLSVVTLEGQP